MNETIKNHLTSYQTSKGYGTSDDEIMETITEEKPVWEGKRDEHRWYTLIPTVVCINGMYLQYYHCSVKGEESSVEDCIGGYKLKDVIQVIPKEETAIVYVPAE